jgi:F0F1-type ATP synthase delta subunit
MRYSAKMYAEALYQMIEEEPARSQFIIGELMTTLTERREKSLAPDILSHFEKRLHSSEKKGRPQVTHLKGGVEIRVGDTLVENSLEKRMKELKQAIAY